MSALRSIHSESRPCRPAHIYAIPKQFNSNQFNAIAIRFFASPLRIAPTPCLCSPFSALLFRSAALLALPEQFAALLCLYSAFPCYASAVHRHPSLYLGTAKLFLSITAHSLCSAFPSRASPLPCPDTQIRRTAPDPVQCLLNALLCFSWASHIIASPLLCSALLRNSSTLLCIAMPSHIFSFLCQCIQLQNIAFPIQCNPLNCHCLSMQSTPRLIRARPRSAMPLPFYASPFNAIARRREDHSSRSSSSSHVKRPLPLFRHCPKPRSLP